VIGFSIAFPLVPGDVMSLSTKVLWKSYLCS